MNPLERPGRARNQCLSCLKFYEIVTAGKCEGCETLERTRQAFMSVHKKRKVEK